MKVKETFFLSHGSPTLSIDESLPARHFLKSWKDTVFPHTPNSILIISGHWETHHPSVNVIAPPNPNDTIYDFYGFPKPMYKLKYPAPGAPHLAKRVKELVLASGVADRVDEDTKRGLDHGAWVPLMLMYPEGCHLSLQLGKGISTSQGGRCSNYWLRECHSQPQAPQKKLHPQPSWALEFDTWLKNTLIEGKYEDVNKYEEKAPYGKVAHPWPDHFYPLHVAMGAAGENAEAKLIHHSWSEGALSYASYQFTSA